MSFLVAVFGYLNYRFIRLPNAVGITAVTTVASLASLGIRQLYPDLPHGLSEAMADINFPQLLLHGLLGVLLFAGAMHVSIDHASFSRTASHAAKSASSA